MSCRKPELNALQECGKSWWLQPRLETDPLQTLQLASCSGDIIISPQHKRTLDAAREQEWLDSITNVPGGAKFVDNANAERTSSCNAPTPRTPPLLTRRHCCYQTVREGEWMCATAAAERRDERCCEMSTRGAWPTACTWSTEQRPPRAAVLRGFTTLREQMAAAEGRPGDGITLAQAVEVRAEAHGTSVCGPAELVSRRDCAIALRARRHCTARRRRRPVAVLRVGSKRSRNPQMLGRSDRCDAPAALVSAEPAEPTRWLEKTKNTRYRRCVTRTCTLAKLAVFRQRCSSSVRKRSAGSCRKTLRSFQLAV